MVCVHLAAKMQGLFNQWANEPVQEGVPTVQTMLSFRGLSTLSQGEFSEHELSRMELVALRGLEWNLRSSAHDILEWIDVMSSSVDMENGTQPGCDAFKELIFDHLQKLVGSHHLLKFAPSKLALVMFMNGAETGSDGVDIMAMLALARLNKNDKEVMIIHNEMRADAILNLT
jgi:hypothetical protein